MSLRAHVTTLNLKRLLKKYFKVGSAIKMCKHISSFGYILILISSERKKQQQRNKQLIKIVGSTVYDDGQWRTPQCQLHTQGLLNDHFLLQYTLNITYNAMRGTQ